MSELAISTIAEVNPAVQIPKGLTGGDAVSFIPMGNVSESGRWTLKQSRPLRSVAAGFTAFEEGDVLLAKITPCMENGKGAHAVGLENGIGFGSTEFHVLRARPGNAPRFVFHLSQWRRFRHAAEGQMVGSAGQQRVPRAFFNEFLVADFDAGQQASIAQVLDTLDTAIHATEAIIAKLKAVKQGLLHDLLTRGIDANGELRPPQAEAPHLYKQSPLGWIPKEWEVIPLGDLSESLVDGPFGSNLKSAHYVENPGVRVVRLQNILAGEYDDSERAFISERHAASLVRNRVIAGDALIASLGDTSYPVGRSCCYPTDLPDAINKADCFRFRSGPRCRNKFVMHSMNGAAARKQVRGYEQGVTMKRINLGNLRRINIALPSMSEQDAIVEHLEGSQQQIDLSLLQLQKLRNEKSALMDDLLTGRVRVTPLLTAEHPQKSA